MKNILLATDLTTNSDRAMERALKLAKEQKSTLHLVHALPHYKAKKVSSSLKTATEDLMRGYLKDYKDAESVKTTVQAVTGQDIYAAILETAKKVNAEMIILGLHGKTKLPDLFAGTTAERIIRMGIWPVLMVRNKPVGPYKNVLSAVDFSPSSQAALRLSSTLAPQASFFAVHAYEVPVYPFETSYIYLETKVAVLDEDQRRIDKFVADEIKLSKKKNKSGMKLTGRIIQGPVYEVLAKQVKNTKSDLLAVGSHGRVGIMPTLLGSLAGTLLTHPPCDILVVREKS
ncbi:MAG: universal stress protein [Alphaproteobacteria bacterium]|nr:universal stress protein [Alphaproteobacteria bacterium]